MRSSIDVGGASNNDKVSWVGLSTPCTPPTELRRDFFFLDMDAHGFAHGRIIPESKPNRHHTKLSLVAAGSASTTTIKPSEVL